MNSIETVFEWLLAATLRASVLVVVILCIQLLLRRWLPASWRHALWLPMLAVLVLPVLPEAPFALSPKAPAVPTPVYAAPISAVINLPDALPVAPANAAVFKPSVAAPAASGKVNFLAIAWLAGAGLVLAAGGIGYHRKLQRIRRDAASPDRDLQITLAETALEAGLKRAPRTVISPEVASPAVTGFVRPVLLLPAGFPAGFSPAEARLILLHEFTHLKRLDLPLNWLMCVLQAMHWFNPLLWFAFARMRADRESACDARVLSIDASDRRAEYGGALLKLQCVTPTRALSLGFVGIFERGSGIKSRIRDISTHRRTRLARQIAGGGILTLLMIFGVTKGQQDSPPADGPERVKEAAPAASGDRPEARFIRRKLHFVKVAEILPVAANALKRAQPGHEAVPQPGGAMGEKADKAPKDAATDAASPSSLLVGDTLLVADVITNSLILQGPPARLIIVESLLDLIDVNPPVQEGGNAARIGTLSQITSQVGKYPHPESEFFESACFQTELQRILGPDYQAYREHIAQSVTGMLVKEGDYVCGDFSQQHVGGYGSRFYVDPKNEKMYLFWLKERVMDKEYQIYGDGPIPAAVLSAIAKHMNATWGHVASFRFDGERLLFEASKEK